MKRLVTTGLLAVAAVLGGVTVASAQAPQAVERSGNTFHVAVCPPNGPPGVARCHAHIVTDAGGRPVRFDGRPNFGFKPYTANDLRAAYGITDQGSSTTTIAIVDAYGYANAEADLAQYRSDMGLPACTSGGANPCFTKADQTGGTAYPSANSGWAQEQALDLDMASAMCPNCRILLVQANSANFDDLAAAVDYAATRAQVISNSYGAAEFSTAGSYAGHYNHPGSIITVSSGDSGYGTQFPASAPTVVAVGGTSLTMSGGAYSSESAWSGAGSGCSTVFNQPSWQIIPTGCTKRMVADVSAVADPNTGVRVFYGGAYYQFGGTSVAAPLIAGVYAVKGATGGPGSSYANGNVTNLHDPASGSNGRCRGVKPYYCTGVVGYDGPTGNGTPKGTGAF